MPLIDKDFAVFLGCALFAVAKVYEVVGAICFAWYILKGVNGQ